MGITVVVVQAVMARCPVIAVVVAGRGLQATGQSTSLGHP